MNPDNSVILEIYKYMNEKGVLISYLGDFNFDVVNSLLASVKKVIHDSGIDFQNQKRFYAVAAECLDNVNRYNYAFTGEKVSEIYTKTYFNISEDKDCFVIQTTSAPVTRAARAISNPGSLMPGMPASEQ